MKKNAFSTSSQRPALARPTDATDERGHSRNIGRYLSDICKLTEDEVAQILAHHRQHGMRFGDSAVALNLASKEEVMWALSQQFRYPYAIGDASVLDQELVVATDPFGESADAFRELRSQLLLGVLAEDQPRKALTVLSVDEGDGRTYFAANIAIALSQTGGRTVLVDANLRAPRLHQLFDIQATSGLSSILSGRSEMDFSVPAKHGVLANADKRMQVEQGVVSIPDATARGGVPMGTPECCNIHPISELPGLYVLPVGTIPPNPLELLQGAEFAALIRQLLAAFDYVIVDTPATSHAADGRVIASQCGAAVVLGRRNISAIRPMQKLLGSLGTTSTKIAGILLNDY